MTRQKYGLHTELVEAWKKKNSGLSDREVAQLFINGILSVPHSSRGTLSNVTVTIVVDRVLHECKERFPLLSQVTCDASGLNFTRFSEQLQDSRPAEVQESLEVLLLSLLDAFGKITAEILTKHLHKELMSISHQVSPKDIERSPTLSLGLARKNRDQK